MPSPPEPLVTGLRQVALGSAAPAQLADFYRRALGLNVLFESNGMVFMDGGGVRLMIGAKPPGEPIGGDAVLYFEPVVWDIAERAVEAAGAAFLHPRVVLQQAEGRELVLRAFKDPEGHSLALLGWRGA
jgi:catechol 2,3-dioxygenase-like lactoylglutathione lyase family enzyme